MLALSQQESAATGVGIRILYGDNYGAARGTTVPLNSTGVEPFANAARQTAFSTDYDAQYVRTETQSYRGAGRQPGNI